jgi:osmotically-inducible protein OsmY
MMNVETRIATMDRPAEHAEADRDLERRVMSFLAARHIPGLRSLEVHASDGIVTVSGRVLTFYEKQLCNQCVRRVAGVMQLINAVDVVNSSTPIGA